jgi:hypothetical protein
VSSQGVLDCDKKIQSRIENVVTNELSIETGFWDILRYNFDVGEE